MMGVVVVVRKARIDQVSPVGAGRFTGETMGAFLHLDAAKNQQYVAAVFVG